MTVLWKNLKLFVEYSALSRKILQHPGGRISRGAYRAINFSCVAKRRNITEIPSIIPIVFPLITGKLNVVSDVQIHSALFIS